jgi:hypothetical protein
VPDAVPFANCVTFHLKFVQTFCKVVADDTDAQLPPSASTLVSVGVGFVFVSLRILSQPAAATAARRIMRIVRGIATPSPVDR